jgi:hypothetical protein
MSFSTPTQRVDSPGTIRRDRGLRGRTRECGAWGRVGNIRRGRRRGRISGLATDSRISTGRGSSRVRRGGRGISSTGFRRQTIRARDRISSVGRSRSKETKKD